MTNGKAMGSKNRGRFTMAEKQNFGYEHTLIYGRYKRELENFARFHAKKLKRESKDQLSEFRGPSKFTRFLSRCIAIRDFMFQKIGEDWIFLAILGVIMALLSFSMDFIIEVCQQAKLYLHEYLGFSVVLQYFAWVTFSLLFILFAAGFTHLVAPQAIDGISGMSLESISEAPQGTCVNGLQGNCATLLSVVIQMNISGPDFLFSSCVEKHCWQNYVDYHRCHKVKGDDYEPCEYFKRLYQSLCPAEYVSKWDDQVAEGRLAAKI